ncbi:MAG: hypothetical protein AAGD05_00810 [Bacteroidota bacterium]
MKAFFPIILPLFIFLTLPCLTQAQSSFPKRNLKFGFGSSIYGESDFQGKTRYLEYERQLFSRFSLGVQGDWGNAQYHAASIENKLRRLGATAHLFFAPIRKSNNQLKLGFGLTYQNSRYDFAALQPNETPNLPVAYSESERGYSAILEYEVFIIRNWSIGTRVAIQQFGDQQRNYFWGLNTGIRF